MNMLDNDSGHAVRATRRRTSFDNDAVVASPTARRTRSTSGWREGPSRRTRSTRTRHQRPATQALRSTRPHRPLRDGTHHDVVRVRHRPDDNRGLHLRRPVAERVRRDDCVMTTVASRPRAGVGWRRPIVESGCHRCARHPARGSAPIRRTRAANRSPPDDAPRPRPPAHQPDSTKTHATRSADRSPAADSVITATHYQPEPTKPHAMRSAGPSPADDYPWTPATKTRHRRPAALAGDRADPTIAAGHTSHGLRPARSAAAAAT